MFSLIFYFFYYIIIYYFCFRQKEDIRYFNWIGLLPKLYFLKTAFAVSNLLSGYLHSSLIVNAFAYISFSLFNSLYMMIIPDIICCFSCRRIEKKKNAWGKQEAKSHENRLGGTAGGRGGFNHWGNQPFPTSRVEKKIPFGNQELLKEVAY